jgi:putative hemolysin/uncharacterized protein YlzI (FlbEa/FlbD family)
MKLLSALAVTAVSAGRIKRQSPEDDGWTLIPANLGITEGTHYKMGGRGNAEYAKAYCESKGGFLPMSENASDMWNYKQLSGSSNYYWTGFRKTGGNWNADPGSGDASFTDNEFMQNLCVMAYAYRTGANMLPASCTTTLNFVCLKNVSAEPAEINSVVDAWNDMVTFPNASTHGCQCLNFLSDADQRYRGQPRDELDHVCLDWQNAIKCQRFEGGVCGPMKENELPSYTNYANCTLNNDPCAAALCEINRKFATDVNNLNGVITPTEVEGPAANCTRAQAGPKFDSCCFTDIFSSIRYDSAASQCVAGVVEAKPTLNDLIIEAEADGWALIPANLGTTEGTHYKVRNYGLKNGVTAHAWCADQGGSLPMSTNSADMINYFHLSFNDTRVVYGNNGYFWTGFKKTAGTWNADPKSGDLTLENENLNQAEACPMYYIHIRNGQKYIIQNFCDQGNGPILCLKDLSASSNIMNDIGRLQEVNFCSRSYRCLSGTN